MELIPYQGRSSVRQLVSKETRARLQRADEQALLAARKVEGVTALTNYALGQVTSIVLNQQQLELLCPGAAHALAHVTATGTIAIANVVGNYAGRL